MYDYAFIGNDSISLLFLKAVIKEKRPRFIVTGNDRIEGRGRKLTPSLLTSFASENSIECIKTSEPNSEDSLKYIREMGSVDFFFVFSFGYYLKNDFLNIPSRMCINIHPSLLPLYRGAAPINRCIMNGDKKSGVSFYKMTLKMDAGPLIISKEIILEEDEISLTLREKIVRKTAEIFIDFDWEKDFPMTNQDDSISSSAPKIMKNEFVLNLNLNAEKMKSHINGLSEYGIKCFLNRKKIKVFSASLYEDRSQKDAGTIEIKDKRIIMNCIKGSISLNEIQPDGKRIMSAESYINGYQLKNGDKICAEFLE
ncbi:MAG: hypothetical protein COX48_01750 [bacterium (Candidatus Stahlbacteria) CG23_combo_of_CG06-09_8_20_14_all_34_7]|nr:MAG: hypothetical protein COX48_01750 [bacterium (Candidatus Stahlbacteria) CG23_combo_of_CG06-09_8_20_14_all_34_7]